MDDHDFRPRSDLPDWVKIMVIVFLSVLIIAVILGMAVY